jgi:tetratricopeptide (TPR) repeat protein
VNTAVIYNGSDRQSLKELFHANTLYYQKDYKKAAAAYDSLIWGERLTPTLDANGIRMATDNLGMAYGLLGDLKKSQATYETAIKQDPEYSGYHYNLACTFSEMDKLDEAIGELRLAYQFIDNQITGEKLPNPRTDDSFKRYMKNEKFLKALAEMEKGK